MNFQSIFEITLQASKLCYIYLVFFQKNSMCFFGHFKPFRAIFYPEPCKMTLLKRHTFLQTNPCPYLPIRLNFQYTSQQNTLNAQSYFLWQFGYFLTNWKHYINSFKHHFTLWFWLWIEFIAHSLCHKNRICQHSRKIGHMSKNSTRL